MSKPFTIEDLRKSSCAYINAHILAEKPKAGQSKYRNKKVEFDGRTFDSKKEFNRYLELRNLERVGFISELECQKVFYLDAGHKKICKYIADFQYKDKDGNIVVEDVKSKHTRKLPVYRLKKKLMLAVLGIEIKEV